MRLTRNFDLEEFRCKDGTIDHEDNLMKLAVNLQKLRDILGVPITINSGYRSQEHNAKVGGAKNSQHLLGKAADIVVEGYSPKSVTEIISDLQTKGVMDKGGLHAYDTFVHYDIRGINARW